MYSWWATDSERGAFDRLKTLHQAAHPNVSVTIAGGSTSSTKTRAEVAANLLAGSPPSTFQANAGADLLQWAAVDTADKLTTENRLVPLSDLFAQSQVTVPQDVMDQLTVQPGGEPFGVPINIHRLNVLYYNVDRRATLAASGHPLDSLATLCPDDPSTAPRIEVRIAVGISQSWVLGILAFENMLVATAGADVYEHLFEGIATGDEWPKIRHALECVQYLSPGFVTNSNRDTWDNSIRRVAQGEADITIMGDWVNGEILKNGFGPNVGSNPFPGTEKAYVFTSDAFVLPIGAPYPNETRDWLRTILSDQGQIEFSRLKGSIPARLDLAVQIGADAAARSEQFKTVRKVLATSGYFPPYYPSSALNEALLRMTISNAGPAQVDVVMALLQDAEPLLKDWQERRTKPPGPSVGP